MKSVETSLLIRLFCCVFTVAVVRANTILLSDGHTLELSEETNKYHAILSYADEGTQSHFHSKLEASNDATHHIVSIEGLGLLGVGVLDASHVADFLAHPNVEVFANDMVYLDYERNENHEGGRQMNATWGLDRINQRALPLDSSYTWDVDVTDDGGIEVTEEVAAIIIDSGIEATHPDWLPGQVELVADCRSGGMGKCVFEGPSIDEVELGGTGHGTHVAGTVASPTWGVAKGLKLYNVRIFGITGGARRIDVYAAIVAATTFAKSRPKTRFVINMSFGGRGSANEPYRQIMQNAYDAGIVLVASAGNDGEDTCVKLPAAFETTISVGATADDDSPAYFSNHGPCTDIYGPGYRITSTNAAWNWSDPCNTTDECPGGSVCLEDGTCELHLDRTISGTSMSSPHVAGAAALILLKQPYLTPAEVKGELLRTATDGAITSLRPNTVNKLLYIEEFALPNWSVRRCPDLRLDVAHHRGKLGAYRNLHGLDVDGCCALCEDEWECQSFTLQGTTCYLYDVEFKERRGLPCPECVTGGTTMPDRAPTTTPPPMALPQLAGSLTCGSSYINTNVGAENYAGNPSGDVVYELVVLTEEDAMVIDTCSAYTNFDTVVRVYSNRDLTTPLGAQDDTPTMGASEACSGGKSQMFIGLTAGTFYVVVEGAEQAEGQFELSLTCAPFDFEELDLPELECGSSVRDKIVNNARQGPGRGPSQGFKWTVPEGDGVDVQFETCSKYNEFLSYMWLLDASLFGTNSNTSVVLGDSYFATDEDNEAYLLRGSSCAENGNDGSRLTGHVPPGEYFVFLGAWRNEGNYELNVACGSDVVPLPLGEDRPADTVVECGSVVQGNTAGAPLLLPNSTASGVVVYAFTADDAFPGNATHELSAEFSTCDDFTSFNTMIVVFSDPGLTQEIASADRSRCAAPVGRNDLATWRPAALEPDTTYYVAVTGPYIYEGDFNFAVTCEYEALPTPAPVPAPEAA